jgi:hypothetical protein
MGLPAVLAGPESDKAGPLGLLTIVLLGIAVYFLYRSMARHIKKVPSSFDPPPTEGPGGGPAGPGAESGVAPPQAHPGSAAGATAREAGAPAEPKPAERPAQPPAEP